MVRGTKFNTKSSPTFETPYESEGFFYVQEILSSGFRNIMFRINQDESEKSEDKIVVSHGLSYKGGVGNTCETIKFFCLPQENSFTKN